MTELAGRALPRHSISALTALRYAVPAILIVVALATPGFLSWPSMLSLLTTVSFIGCVAVGMTLITISGNIMSFSLGATAGAAAMVFVLAVNAVGVPLGILIALVFGGLVSGAQGFCIGYVRANPIIISIASLSLIYGIAEAFTESGTVYAAPGTSYGPLKGNLLGLPIEFVLLLVVTCIGQALLSLTSFGRNVIMCGSSFRAAEAVGVRTWRTVTGAYAWAGGFTALAGIMLAIRYDAASMSYGMGYDYDAI